jgi:hypothetical protein
MAHQTILDQDKLRADSDLDIVQAELVQCKNQKANILSAIKAGIFTQTTRDELLRLEQEEAELEDRIHQAKQLTAELPTEDDIISFLELFREGLEDQTLKRSALLDAFVIRAEVHADHVLIFFRIKKEDRQASADLPEAWGECSPSAVKWTCGASKRTLYHYNGYFVLRIAA